MRPLVAVLLLLATPAAAQRAGCGYGEGLAALRAAERGLAAGLAAPGLGPGREAAQSAAETLRGGTASFTSCGCRLIAEHVAEAAGVAEQAIYESSVARIRQALERARFSIGQAQQRAGRQGCS